MLTTKKISRKFFAVEYPISVPQHLRERHTHSQFRLFFAERSAYICYAIAVLIRISNKSRILPTSCRNNSDFYFFLFFLHEMRFHGIKMVAEQDEILDIFKQTGALLEGHFVLRSGLHSGHFFQCARVCEHLDQVSRLATLLLEKLKSIEFDTVLAPAMGGLVIGQEVARQAGKRYLFVEKVNDALALRRDFKMESGERILIIEDVITRGGRVQEAIEIVKQNNGKPIGLGVLVDRSEGKAQFEIPAIALLNFAFPTYPPDNLPESLAAIPCTKPGS